MVMLIKNRIKGNNMSQKSIFEIVSNMHKWFIETKYKGIDPYQIDEKAFKKINNSLFVGLLRKYLKPFHGYIPNKVFSNNPSIYHSKALGLIISGNSYLYKITGFAEYLEENEKIICLLKKERSSGFKNFCWGVPMDTGNDPRYPKYTPFVCVTSPIAHCLIDYYLIVKDNEILGICKSAAHYLMYENGFDQIYEDIISVYYSPLDRKYVYNSNIMAASFLYRLNEVEENEETIRFADQLINFVLTGQSKDGSWIYADSQSGKQIKTIDNRHTGFVLEHLSIIYKIIKNQEVKKALESGCDYYLNNLFNGNIPKWSPSQTYPIDIHDVAQAIITLTQIRELEKARSVIDFAINKMSNGVDEFYYKYFKNGKLNKTVFFRWGQAWMYKALVKYIDYL